MIEATIELDTAILVEYDPFLKQYFDYAIANQLTTRKELKIKLDVKNDEYDAFISQYEVLMQRYKIHEDHYGYILYILQTVYSKSELLLDTIMDAKQAIATLKPLIKYAEFKEETKLYDTEKAVMDYAKLIIGRELSFDIPLPNTFIVNSIVNSLKSQTANFSLANIFTGYNSLPSAKYLKKELKKLEFVDLSPFSLPVLEMIINLKQYFKTYLGKELKRKIQELVYDLLYLMNLLIHLKKKNYKNRRLIERKKDFTMRRRPTDDKNKFIELITNNYNRRLNNLSPSTQP